MKKAPKSEKHPWGYEFTEDKRETLQFDLQKYEKTLKSMFILFLFLYLLHAALFCYA